MILIKIFYKQLHESNDHNETGRFILPSKAILQIIIQFETHNGIQNLKQLQQDPLLTSMKLSVKASCLFSYSFG